VQILPPSAPLALRKECIFVLWSGETTPQNKNTLFGALRSSARNNLHMLHLVIQEFY